MNTATQIMETLTRLGVTVKANGDRLRIEPASKVPADLIPRIREAKPEILAHLESKSRAVCGSASCGGCYSIVVYDGNGPFIHPPQPSRDWLDWLKRWEPKGAAQ